LRKREKIVVDIALAVQQLPAPAGTREVVPLGASLQALLQPVMLDAPAANEEVEIICAGITAVS
jgi:hypothetical protein